MCNPIGSASLGEVHGAVRALLESNQVSYQGHRYTRPAPSTYEQQWLWDSCFHALIYCHFDLSMAKDELSSLLYHRGVDMGGMVPHMIYWAGGGEALWGQPYASTITQPPMIASAALKVYEVSQDRTFLQTNYELIREYYEWLGRERDPDHDHLVSIIHPWESGWDASPRWDSQMGLSNPTDFEAREARVHLAQAINSIGCDIQRVLQDGVFCVEPIDFNAIYAANLAALSQIASTLDRPSDAARYDVLANATKDAVRLKMWDDRNGTFWDLAGVDETPIRVPTCAAFVTLYAGIPTLTQAERLLAQMRTRFSAPYPIPTVAVGDPLFSATRYWRGNTWLNVNWFIHKGLQLYGFADLAAELASRCQALVEKSGFREYYDPFTGDGLGSLLHSWSGIVLDMIEK